MTSGEVLKVTQYQLVSGQFDWEPLGPYPSPPKGKIQLLYQQVAPLEPEMPVSPARRDLFYPGWEDDYLPPQLFR